jgi:hypothetical protein
VAEDDKIQQLHFVTNGILAAAVPAEDGIKPRLNWFWQN